MTYEMIVAAFQRAFPTEFRVVMAELRVAELEQEKAALSQSKESEPAE